MSDVCESAVDPRLTRRRSVEIEVRLLRVRVVVARPSGAVPTTLLFARTILGAGRSVRRECPYARQGRRSDRTESHRALRAVVSSEVDGMSSATARAADGDETRTTGFECRVR